MKAAIAVAHSSFLAGVCVRNLNADTSVFHPYVVEGIFGSACIAWIVKVNKRKMFNYVTFYDFAMLLE